MFAFFESAKSVSQLISQTSLFLLAAGIALAFSENRATRVGGVFVALAAWVGLTSDWDAWAKGVALVSTGLAVAIAMFVAVRWKNIKKSQDYSIGDSPAASTHWGEEYKRVAESQEGANQ